MTRLIDSDKCPCRKCKIPYCHSQCQSFYDWLDTTVDAEPVRHGKWIVTAGGKECDCPVCGEWFDNTCNYDIRKTWKWCPVCGTRLEVDGD